MKANHVKPMLLLNQSYFIFICKFKKKKSLKKLCLRVGNHCPCIIQQMGRFFRELVGCMVAELKNPVFTSALLLRQNRHAGNESDRFPAVTCIIKCSLRVIPKIPFHEFPWVLSLFIITYARAYTHNISVSSRLLVLN